MNEDRPLVEIGPEFVGKQLELRTLTSLVTYYYSLLHQEHLPDALVADLVSRWQDSYLGVIEE